MGLLRQIEGGTQRGLSGLEDRAREANIGATARRLSSMDPAAAAEMVVDRTPSYVRAVHDAPEGRRKVIRDAQIQGAMSNLQGGGELEMARRLNRGPLGGQHGLVEGAAQFANRQGVRRGGLAAAGVGATVGSGILLTEGAQQLMTLMDFLRHGQEVEQRAEESPLA